MIDLDGKNLRELARSKWTETDKRAYVHPGVSPDGEEVVFCAVQHIPKSRAKEMARLGIVKVKTGEVRWIRPITSIQSRSGLSVHQKSWYVIWRLWRTLVICGCTIAMLKDGHS